MPTINISEAGFSRVQAKFKELARVRQPVSMTEALDELLGVQKPGSK